MSSPAVTAACPLPLGSRWLLMAVSAVRQQMLFWPLLPSPCPCGMHMKVCGARDGQKSQTEFICRSSDTVKMKHLRHWALFDSFSLCKRWRGKSENYLCQFRQSIIYSPSPVQKCDSPSGSQEKGLSWFNAELWVRSLCYRIQN